MSNEKTTAAKVLDWWNCNLNMMADDTYQVSLAMVALEGLIERLPRSLCNPEEDNELEDWTSELIAMVNELRNRCAGLEGQIRNGKRLLARCRDEPEPHPAVLKQI